MLDQKLECDSPKLSRFWSFAPIAEDKQTNWLMFALLLTPLFAFSFVTLLFFRNPPYISEFCMVLLVGVILSLVGFPFSVTIVYLATRFFPRLPSKVWMTVMIIIIGGLTAAVTAIVKPL